ncbi:5-methyltetrahydrofolate--homocysteine methyltransferase [Desulfobaculum xiamenense]|uniref:Methionine synthase n=2 Tax=Desulfobaculum xiamenense TaxID=995050 RepID=A0A846QQK3_9BACT|nr:5-methyltetrahydrofolate--homocysteine methyltransferase [Desulfobaculum xiamenense]
MFAFDGGMGTLLQARGLKPGQSPEAFGLANPDIVADIHREYINAGARVVTTNTFGGTDFKLDAGLEVVSFNREMTAVARQAAGDRAFVAGDIGPTGKFCRPLGDVDFRDLVEAFKRQIRGLSEGGADLLIIETQFDLAECRAAVIAAREVCDLPVAVSMTFEDGVSLTGTRPLTFIDTMQNLGVELIGTNCSAGPEGMLEVVRAMLPRLSTPFFAQPNAGLPELEDGRTVFRLDPETFAEQIKPFVALGAKAIGGCCGTTPEHIRCASKVFEDVAWSLPEPPERDCLVLTSRAQSVAVSPHRRSKVIGERINPTGKKQLTAELQAGQFSEAFRFAKEQLACGAHILDVNVGAPMVREETLLPDLVSALVSRVQAPLCLDSTNADAIRAALDVYPGSPLVNSISGEPGRMQALGPLCKHYGAPFIMLPLLGRKLPVTASDRLAVIESLLREADDLGVPRRLIMVDALVLTVSSKPESAKACLEVIRHCRDEWNLATVCGLSNISFGLPARELLNASFLVMGMTQGLSAFIANPGSNRLMESLSSSEVLLARDPQARDFVAGYAEWKPTGGPLPGRDSHLAGAAAPVETPGQAVIAGAAEKVVELVEAELAKGRDPFEIVDSDLIPAITEVGEKYERKEYFLPQLLQSAETMQLAFEHLRPHLEAVSGGKERVKVVMATVEGDIHDIGKNIVILMLRNNGFEVIDLGKDVPAERIVETARRENAAVIGLSALMTTTMVRMEETVNLVREQGLNCKVMVGGAVVTQDYADRIGADGYSRDAVDAVKVAKALSGAVAESRGA